MAYDEVSEDVNNVCCGEGGRCEEVGGGAETDGQTGEVYSVFICVHKVPT